MLSTALPVPYERRRRALLLARRDVVLAELRRTMLARRHRADDVVLGVIEELTRSLGRCPRVTEVAAAADVEVEAVLDAIAAPPAADATRPGRASEHRELWMWLRGGLSRDEIARRTGTSRLEVSRRLRASVRSRMALQRP